MSDLYLDGVPLNRYLRDVVTKNVSSPTDRHRFWASQDSSPVMVDPMRDVAQYEFGGLRLVNSLHFEISRFPLQVKAEYWHPLTNRWTPLRQQIGKVTTIDPAYDVAEQRAVWEGDPVRFEIRDSSPTVIDRSPAALSAGTHPQHFGSRHWVPVKWKTAPVTTKAVRFIIERLPLDSAVQHPTSPNGHYTPYSVALRNIQIGCRVDDIADVPDAGLLEEYATSTDLLGSRVTYRLKEYEPEHATRRVDGLHWRSEPQPVNYAVVNFYADVRDPQGQAQVIDRFYIDPLTVGPTLNLYYTNDEPDSDFAADTTRLAYPVVEQFGASQVVHRHPQSNAATGLSFSSVEPSWVQVDNAYLQWDPYRPWWVGLSLRLDADTGTHPWLAFGGNTLRQNGGAVEFVTADGTSLSVPLEAGQPVLGAEVNLTLAYVPVGHESPLAEPGTLTLSVAHAYSRETLTLAVAPEALGERPEDLFVGRYSTGSTAGVPAMTVRGMVLKTETPLRGYLDGFLTDPEMFILRDTTQGAHDFTLNALLRMHPSLAHDDHPGGLVGGPGDRYEDVEWTPISRDYALRQGFLRFPATLAKHFKFEFTNLVYEAYDSLVPINRSVRLFPVELVHRHERFWGTDPVSPLLQPDVTLKAAAEHFDYASQAPGVETMMDVTDVGRYESAIERLRVIATDMTERGSGTEAYVADHPKIAERLAETGWIWSFQPWHVGTRAPRWLVRQKHRYETVTVAHRTQTGFFVGLRTVEAHRVDYLTDDDTEVYHENFMDDRHIASATSMTLGDGWVESISSNSEIVSKTLPSVREVRAVQFATVQSDNIPLLPDDGFVSEDVAEHWAAYGDATLERSVGKGIMVNRGYFARTWGMLEGGQTYGDHDGALYGTLETGHSEGMVGGGLQSEHVSGSPSGRIYAAARVTAMTSMAGPLRLEIVSVTTGQVLAVDERHLVSGEEAVLKVAYQVGTAMDVTTWGDLDGTLYGDLEAQTYADLQDDPIGGPVFVRIYQDNPSQDRFLVERLSLFDAPISWQFTVDDGLTWYDALDVRNDPQAVLSFPEPGKALRWRARLFHKDAEISALTVRPWYGGLLGSIGRSATDFTGPNRSVLDDYPETEHDPLFSQSHDPIPSWWYQRDVANPFSAPPSQPLETALVVPEQYVDPESPLPTPEPVPEA